MKLKILMLYFAFLSLPCLSQTRTISGKIKDLNTNSDIEYCTVFQPNTSNGAVADEKGVFSLSVSSDAAQMLVFKSFGYKTDTLKLVADKNEYEISLQSENNLLEDVVFTGATKATLIRENPIAIASISTTQIERTTASNVIDILVKNVPGLTAVKTGPNISKPFIHGLGYNRVLTLYDGIRQEGQQYGDEHGLEVDDYNIAKAEVIKGPASLLYGSDALAGVISLFPNIPNEKDGKIHGKYVGEYQTNNNLIGNSFRLNYTDKRLAFSVCGSYRMAKNYRNAIDGRVYLSNFNVANFSALAGYYSKKGHTNFNFTVYDNHQGIPDGSRDSATRKFTKQIFEGDNDSITNRPFVSEQELNSYNIPVLAQHIQHYRVYSHSFYSIGKGDIAIVVGGQQNIRREYTHPTKPYQAGMYMRLNTLNYGVRYNAPKIGKVEIATGFNGMLQQNKNKDATNFPIPNYKLLDGGIFLYAKWKHRKWSISGGVRYDLRKVQWGDFYVGSNPETGFDKETQLINDSSAYLQFEAYKKLFQGVSGSIGATFQVNKSISLKLNVGRAYRSPNITEIGSNGLDPGAHIVYLGNRNFQPEFSLQEDFGVLLKLKNISAEAAFFNNNIQNYIYMSALADAQGNPVLDAQGNRTYQYQQATAQLYGSEISVSVHPEKINGIRWDNNLSVVYGFNKKSTYKDKGVEGEYLPLIPPLKFVSCLSYELTPHVKHLVSLLPKLEVAYNANQNRFLGSNGTETFTPQYTLFNAGIVAEIAYNTKQKIQVLLQANNLFDKAYQSHLNRLKYFEYYSQSRNNRLGIYNMGRNLIIKVIIPF